MSLSLLNVMTMSIRKIIYSFYVDQETKHRLKKVCDKLNLSQSEVARDAINEKVEKLEKKAKGDA
jgi:uncharacterized membrane protein (DUF106 family)